MSKIEVQLDAYVVPDDHLVFKCSPGKTYRFYLAVKDAKVVFPDIRGLDKLSGSPDQWVDKDVLEIIASDRWERELQSRERGNKEQGSQGVSTVDRRTLTFLKRLFFEGKKGDLVVVPVDGYAKDVLIGEFLSDAGAVSSVEAKDGEYTGTYFGRAVRWRATIQKLHLSADLITALHTQTAVFALGRSLREEVYRYAYANFIYMGRYVSEFRTAKERFTAEDSAVLATWVNGFDVLRNSLQTKAGIDEETSFFELGLSQLDDAVAAELRINIQSPGEMFVRSATPFALSLMALFALAGCDSKQVVDNGVTVHLKTVGGATTAQQEEIERNVNALTVALGDKRLEDAAKLARRAATDAKMSTGATLKSSGKRSN
jgi:hypothetical protein